MNLQIELNKIGLTPHESKIYLTLRELGQSTTGPIIKKTNIHASKIYENLNRLSEKGLVTHVVKNNIKYFQAVEPNKLFDLLKEKEQELQEQKQLLQTILPNLNELQPKEETQIEVFSGWQGMETAYAQLRNSLQKGETNYIFGAGKGENEERTKIFFNKHLRIMAKKGIKQQIIFNEKAKGNLEEHEKHPKLFKAKYLKHSTPTEINIWKDRTMIILLKKEPQVILIKDKETAKSFLEYFKTLWTIAS